MITEYFAMRDEFKVCSQGLPAHTRDSTLCQQFTRPCWVCDTCVLYGGVCAPPCAQVPTLFSS